MADLILLLAMHTKSTATPGKGRSFKCDRNCANTSTKICKRTIAVAEKYGTLPDLNIY